MRAGLQGFAGPDGSVLRWFELPGTEPAIVFVHGLGSTSAAQFLGAATDAALAERRRLLVDLFGFGHSDRPLDVGYSLTDHAAAIAAALDHAGAQSVDLVGHSLGGSVAIVLARLRPDLVGRLVAIEPNLVPWDGTASVEIARQREQDFVERGFDRLLEDAAPDWAATLRLADPRAVYRTAVGLCEGTIPTMRESLTAGSMPRALIWGELSPPPPDLTELLDAGVAFVTVADSGHVPMADNPRGFVAALGDALSL